MMDADVEPALTISDPETFRLAKELAELRGVGMDEAVAWALRDRLEWQRQVQRDVADMLNLAREIREHLVEPLTQDSIDEMLYGPDGLPG